MLPSNQIHIERARQRIMATGADACRVLGLAFKPGTDDLRASPLITLVRDSLAGRRGRHGVRPRHRSPSDAREQNLE